jgi:hypothetical protein
MRAWITLALCLVALPASAARFRGELGSVDTGTAGRVTIRARFTTDGEWVGRYTCRGKGCPVRRGQITWFCSFGILVFGSVGGAQGGFDLIGDCDGHDGMVPGRWIGTGTQGWFAFWRVQ